jgi:hypothetical protein
MTTAAPQTIGGRLVYGCHVYTKTPLADALRQRQSQQELTAMLASTSRDAAGAWQ